ncbi:13788_t:CDS:2, partial [Acaulospora colombiana]
MCQGIAEELCGAEAGLQVARRVGRASFVPVVAGSMLSLHFSVHTLKVTECSVMPSL